MSDPTWGYTAETAPARLRELYKWLEPDPNAEYGMLLPFARDKTATLPSMPKLDQYGVADVVETINMPPVMRPAMPSMARDFLTGGLDLMAGVETGEVTPRAAVQLGLGGFGVGASLAPRGALAAGAVRGAKALPMDETSRFARARAMGHDPDLPLYHTAHGPDFEEFGFGLGSAQSGGLPSVGIWAAEDPRYANALAHAFDIQGSSATRVMPLVARKSKTGTIILRGDETPFDIHNTIRAAWHDGYDAIKFTNYNTLPDGTPTPTWIFRDPNQLRSRFAAFDLAKRDSSDLLAGFAVPSPAPVPGLANFQPPPEPGFAMPTQGRPVRPDTASERWYRLPTGAVGEESGIPNDLRPLHRRVY